MFKQSIKSCLDFVRLLRLTKPKFSDVDIPTLIIQCENDETVKLSSADYIKNQIGEHAEVFRMKNGMHLVLKYPCEERIAICEKIYNFLVL